MRRLVGLFSIIMLFYSLYAAALPPQGAEPGGGGDGPVDEPICSPTTCRSPKRCNAQGSCVTVGEPPGGSGSSGDPSEDFNVTAPGLSGITIFSNVQFKHPACGSFENGSLVRMANKCALGGAQIETGCQCTCVGGTVITKQNYATKSCPPLGETEALDTLASGAALAGVVENSLAAAEGLADFGGAGFVATTSDGKDEPTKPERRPEESTIVSAATEAKSKEQFAGGGTRISAAPAAQDEPKRVAAGQAESTENSEAAETAGGARTASVTGGGAATSAAGASDTAVAASKTEAAAEAAVKKGRGRSEGGASGFTSTGGGGASGGTGPRGTGGGGGAGSSSLAAVLGPDISSADKSLFGLVSGHYTTWAKNMGIGE